MNPYCSEQESKEEELIHAIIDFSEELYRASGREPERIILPNYIWNLLKVYFEKEREEELKTGNASAMPTSIGDHEVRPVSGIDAYGRLWVAATEVVSDVSV